MAVKNGDEPISYTQTPLLPEVVFLVGHVKEVLVRLTDLKVLEPSDTNQTSVFFILSEVPDGRLFVGADAEVRPLRGAPPPALHQTFVEAHLQDLSLTPY